MSVTFSTTFNPVQPHILTCACGASTADTTYPTYGAAYAARSATPACGDDHCADYTGTVRPVQQDPAVNMSNTNAEELLNVLGIGVGEPWGDRCAGQMDASDFLGRILIAHAVNPVDAGRPSTQTGIVIDMGRSEHYVDDRLLELEHIATDAVNRGLKISWG